MLQNYKKPFCLGDDAHTLTMNLVRPCPHNPR